MQIGDWEQTPDLNEIYRDAIKHDLVDNIAELDAFGFTVIPPDKVAPKEFQTRLQRALLDLHERKSGMRIDDPSSAKHGGKAPVAAYWSLLQEDRAFEEALLNPAVFTIARYLCGRSVVLSELLGMLKNADERPTHLLHTDQHGTPPPLPPYSQVCNVTWVLTEYTPDNGPVAIVPGSHRYGRVPMPYEANFLADGAPVTAIPVEAAAGSLIVWHGNTWHGSYPRKAEGLRLNLIFVFCRSYMRPIRDYRAETPKEIIDRNPPEFAELLGMSNPYPFRGDQMSPPDQIQKFIAAGRNPWA